MLTVYIGYDYREDIAYRVARKSCLESKSNVEVIPLKANELREQRLLWRPVENHEGRQYDFMSAAYQSTEFASSRFLIPHIHKKGWCLFVDADVVFTEDVQELFDLADDQYAVMCVKHQYEVEDSTKMDNQINEAYRRKNWSSVMLFNCDHPAHQRMPVAMLNQWPGILLHQFAWLKDDEIGELPPDCNWLVNVIGKPNRPRIAHFTLGGPWFTNWKPRPHDEIWINARKSL